MTFILFVDKVLDLKLVQYALLLTCVLLSVTAAWQSIRCFKLSAELTSCKKDVVVYESKLTQQNEAVNRLADDTQSKLKQVDEAELEVGKLKLKLAERKVQIKEVVLKGTCDEMVGQTIEELQK